MANTSKKYLEEGLKKAIWRSFKDEIKDAKTKNDLDEIISKLLSLPERILFEKRLAILFLLKQGLSYRQISRIVDVTPKTVGFVKNGLIRKKSKKKQYSPLSKSSHPQKSWPKYPAFTCRGRWRFLNS